jgi:hypothetical protein
VVVLEEIVNIEPLIVILDHMLFSQEFPGIVLIESFSAVDIWSEKLTGCIELGKRALETLVVASVIPDADQALAWHSLQCFTR